MSLFGLCVIRLAKAAHWIGSICEGASFLLTGMLPALLPPAALTKLVRAHYDRNYDDTLTRFTSTTEEWPLEQWEEDVLAHHHKVASFRLRLFPHRAQHLAASTGQKPTCYIIRLGPWRLA